VNSANAAGLLQNGRDQNEKQTRVTVTNKHLEPPTTA
jgi:hypothetical protein